MEFLIGDFIRAVILQRLILSTLMFDAPLPLKLLSAALSALAIRPFQ